MTDPTQREPERRATPGDSEAVLIAVTVTRTGGFAGLRRTWRTEPDPADAPHWIALIDDCPWDAADPARPIPPSGADRFMWHLDAQCGDAAREAALADPEVEGPWRELIDAVKAAPDTDADTARPPRAAR
jgi:hypothetical protein